MRIKLLPALLIGFSAIHCAENVHEKHKTLHMGMQGLNIFANFLNFAAAEAANSNYLTEKDALVIAGVTQLVNKSAQSFAAMIEDYVDHNGDPVHKSILKTKLLANPEKSSQDQVEPNVELSSAFH